MNMIEKYEVIEVIGRGAMGIVYKGFHPHLKTYVAIKEVIEEGAGDTEMRGRLEREAEILAQLPPHPNIVSIKDGFRWRDKFYLVMDYIEGGTLSDLIEGNIIDVSRVKALLDQILSGLAVIHSCGIVHRDIRPSNILLDSDGVAYISDFGIAKAAHDFSEARTMLTAKYVAPELIEPALGRGGREQQIDLYAVGMLAYELLTGANRFRSVFHFIYNAGPHGAP